MTKTQKEIKPELSIIILNYNTKELLEECLNSIKACEKEISFEVIVSDNASSDGSQKMIKEKFPWVKYVEGGNDGYAIGNNRAKKMVDGQMVLFLNPDTIVHKNVLKKTTDYLKSHIGVGALTCKLILSDGTPDKDTRRRFPTPAIAFEHLVLGINRRYWYEDVPDNAIQEVDAIQGAFFLTWKEILDRVGWFDEKYYFDGEDIDLCFQIHKAGYKLVYYPEVSIIHYKGVTKGKVKEWKHKVTPEQRKKLRLSGVSSMERFFRKNLWSKYPVIFDYFVVFGINIFKIIRYIKVVFLSSY